MLGPPAEGPGGGSMGWEWSGVISNIHIDINMNIDIHIIINMNIYYLLSIIYDLLSIAYCLLVAYCLLPNLYKKKPKSNGPNKRPI